MAFDDGSDGGSVRIGFQFFDFGHEQDVLEEFWDALLRECGNRNHRDRSSPVLGLDAVTREFAFHFLHVGVGPVDLVDRDKHRHLGILHVVDGFDGRRLHAFFGRDDENCNVGKLSAAGTHCCERLVTRGINERDRLTLMNDLVCTDVLRDASGFARYDVGTADGIEDRGFAVVDVTHDRDDGRT